MVEVVVVAAGVPNKDEAAGVVVCGCEDGVVALAAVVLEEV